MRDNQKTLLQTQVFKVIEKRFQGQRFAVIENSDWANALAFDQNGLLNLVKQKRYGGAFETVEPAGGIVDKGSTPLNTAKDELREEVGLVSDNWHSTGSFMPNPALMNNRCHCFVCFDAIETKNWEPSIGEERFVIEPKYLKAWVFDQLTLHGLVLATVLLAARNSEIILKQNSDWGRAFRDICSI